jgi:PAS domain S-box-containing protein
VATAAESWHFDPTGFSLIGDLWSDPERLIGITETDGTTSRYVDVSPSVERILGYTREEILRMSPGELVASREEVAQILGDLADRTSLRFTVQLRHKNGFLVTATIRAHVHVVANRQLVITISEPIPPPQWEAPRAS